MDPATAISNAIAAFFQFLSTPAGQQFATDILKIDNTFNSKLGDLFNHLHSQISGK